MQKNNTIFLITMSCNSTKLMHSSHNHNIIFTLPVIKS